MTKRSTVTLFALLALIAAFGLILTGCPDPNSETKTEWKDRDKPSVQIEDVAYVETSGSPNEITFDVVLPSGEWNPAAVATAAVSTTTLASVFAITTHTSAQATVNGWTDWAATTIDPADPKVLKVSRKAAAYALASISKVSVSLASVSGIAALIDGSPSLTMSTAAAEWSYTGTDVIITVEEVTNLVHGVDSTSGQSVDVTLKLSGGASWVASPGEGILKTLLAFTNEEGTTVIFGGSWTVPTDASGSTLTFTAVAANAASGNATITAKLVGSVVPTSLITSTPATRVDLESAATSPITVTLAPGSQGKPSFNSIVGLSTGVGYLVQEEDGTWKQTANTGTLAAVSAFDATNAAPTGLGTGVTTITGLTAGETYDVYLYKASAIALPVNSGLTFGKNAVIFISANGYAATVSAGAGSPGSTLIFMLSAVIAEINTTQVNGAAPASDHDVIKATSTWTFSGYEEMDGATVNFDVGKPFFIVTPCGADTAFVVTRTA